MRPYAYRHCCARVHACLVSLYRRPFYVGDVIQCDNGPVATNAPTSTTGFLEAITLGGVVIRNFQMKQTLIPFTVFNNMVVQNWTRRATKTVVLDIYVSSHCTTAAVKTLAKFGKEWLDSSDQVLQTGYKKCVVSSASMGFTLQIIFFPAIGARPPRCAPRSDLVRGMTISPTRLAHAI